MPKKILPVLYSLPTLEKFALPPRAETLAAIESGALDHIDFTAQVFNTKPNRNHVTFQPEDLEAFAASFKDMPFLRNHDTSDIGARDGTILMSALTGEAFEQMISLTTRRGMIDFVEGRIDRFSIGWNYDDILCTICNTSWFGCPHMPGRSYETASGPKVCELLFTNPKGKETSAVNSPAVDGTSILSELQSFKAIRGKSPAVTNSNAHKGGTMAPKKKVLQAGEPVVLEEEENNSIPEAELQAEQEAAETLLGVREHVEEMEAQLAQSNAILSAQCEHLLSAGLASSRLPELVQARLRKQFTGKIFKASELQAAITEAKEEVSSLLSGSIVRGPTRITGMFTSGDQFQAAVDDLLGAPRDADKANLKVARLSGIREAYLLATGDRDFLGGYFPEFALGDTTSFPVVVKNAINKRLAEAWKKYGAAGYDWWKEIVSIEHFTSLQEVDWLILGTIGTLPTVAEQGEYTELPVGDNGETSDWSKYGGYVGLTLEAVLRDDVRAFKRLPDEVAMGGMRNISEQIAAIFTDNSGAGPTLSDTGALFNATAVTTKGGHKNLLTTALGTDLTAWRAIEMAMFIQPMHIKNATGLYGTGKPQAVRPKFCLVPQALRGAADDLFVKTWNASGENLIKGYVTPLTVPEWTDATDYAAVADPNILPGIMLGEIFGLQPQVYVAGNESDPAMFSNDESRIKVRQFLTVGIANWRALHKSNVAG
jgi:hypothetical protein